MSVCGTIASREMHMDECAPSAQRFGLRHSISFSLGPGLRAWYPLGVALPAKTPRSEPDAIREERAARLEAMFRRWASEDVHDEPDWDPSDVARFELPEGGVDVSDDSSANRA